MRSPEKSESQPLLSLSYWLQPICNKGQTTQCLLCTDHSGAGMAAWRATAAPKGPHGGQLQSPKARMAGNSSPQRCAWRATPAPEGPHGFTFAVTAILSISLGTALSTQNFPQILVSFCHLSQRNRSLLWYLPVFLNYQESWLDLWPHFQEYPWAKWTGDQTCLLK